MHDAILLRFQLWIVTEGATDSHSCQIVTSGNDTVVHIQSIYLAMISADTDTSYEHCSTCGNEWLRLPKYDLMNHFPLAVTASLITDRIAATSTVNSV